MLLPYMLFNKLNIRDTEFTRFQFADSAIDFCCVAVDNNFCCLLRRKIMLIIPEPLLTTHSTTEKLFYAEKSCSSFDIHIGG